RVSGAFASEVCRRPPPKLLVDDVHNAVSRFDVTLPPSLQQSGHVNPCVVEPVHGRLPWRILPLYPTVSKFSRISRVTRQRGSGQLMTLQASWGQGVRDASQDSGAFKVWGVGIARRCSAAAASHGWRS